jgi:hypothetical protein
MAWRPRVRTGRGATGTGSATSNGSGIDYTQTVAGVTRIFDVTGVARPLAVEFTCAVGDLLDMATTTTAAALADENHASWTVVRAPNGASNIEQITAKSVIGVRVRRTAGSGSSSVRAYAITRGPAYDPAYSPTYDVPFAGTNDARRLLRQAGFGERMGEAATLVGGGQTVGQWFTAQMSAGTQLMANTYGDNNSRMNMVTGWLTRGMITDTAVARWRYVWAAHQLWCLGSIFQTEFGSFPFVRWANRMSELLDSNLLDVFKFVCEDVYMGFFLNNLDNRGFDGSVDILASQNFTRELFQLFSMGQWRLNKDGSYQLSGGERIPTYVRADIVAAAQAFSGMRNDTGTNGLMDYPPSGGFNHQARGAKDFPTFGITHPAYTAPQLADDAVFRQTMKDRTYEVLQYLLDQDTTLVYVARHFIHQLVTDNPTPQYIRRVVAALENNGFGVRGDLKAMYRAITLDPEARGNSKTGDYGRAMDYFLPTAALGRAVEQEPILDIQTYTGTLTNGSAVITGITPANCLAIIGPEINNNGTYPKIEGTSVPASTNVLSVQSNTQITMTQNATANGTVTLTVTRHPSSERYETLRTFSGYEGAGGGAGVVSAQNQFGLPNSVFGYYPFDAQVTPGLLGPATRIWTSSSILLAYKSWIGAISTHFTDYHPIALTANGGARQRAGQWLVTQIASGSPTDTQMVDRAIEVLTCGRGIPAAARTEIIGLLSDLQVNGYSGSGGQNVQFRGAHAVGAVALMPEAMEQV